MTFVYHVLPGEEKIRVIHRESDKHIGYIKKAHWLGESCWQPYLLNGDPLLGVSTIRALAAQRLKDFYDYRGGEL